nr:hypothetical protein [Tanacetum cinerariifolium]
MAALKYKEEHNKVGYLLKPTRSDDYHQTINFLSGSHIRYALTTNPIIFDSLVKQFWSTATLKESELGPPAILATIDKTPYTITEALVRSRLQLADDGGVVDLPILEIYFGMDNIGYVTEGKLTFFKNNFSPQWRFLVHTLLHCLSTKSERGMVYNIGNAKKFLMPQSPDPVAPVLDHDHSSAQPATAAGSFPTAKYVPLGGDFHPSPPRSSHAPLAG